MRCGPGQIDTTEQLLEHRNAGISGLEVRVVGEGDRQRTWGTAREVIQTRDAGNSMGKNTGREIDCLHGISPNTNKKEGKDSTSKTTRFPMF
jgi:hypothetical protein